MSAAWASDHPIQQYDTQAAGIPRLIERACVRISLDDGPTQSATASNRLSGRDDAARVAESRVVAPARGKYHGDAERKAATQG